MKFILASHGDFAKGLLSSLNMLLGPQEGVEAFGLYPEEEAARLGERLAASIAGQPEGSVVFFTDLYFGSPFNQVVALARTHDIYHITGVNLPALIEAAIARNAGKSPQEACVAAMAASQDSIKDVRLLLAQEGQEEEEW